MVMQVMTWVSQRKNVQNWVIDSKTYLRFQVAMDNTLAVHVMHSAHHGTHDTTCFGLREALVLANPFQQFAALQQFQHQVGERAVDEEVDEADDVGVTLAELQALHFGVHVAMRLGHDLHGSHFAGFPVHALPAG